MSKPVFSDFKSLILSEYVRCDLGNMISSALCGDASKMGGKRFRTPFGLFKFDIQPDNNRVMSMIVSAYGSGKDSTEKDNFVGAVSMPLKRASTIADQLDTTVANIKYKKGDPVELPTFSGRTSDRLVYYRRETELFIVKRDEEGFNQLLQLIRTKPMMCAGTIFFHPYGAAAWMKSEHSNEAVLMVGRPGTGMQPYVPADSQPKAEPVAPKPAEPKNETKSYLNPIWTSLELERLVFRLLEEMKSGLYTQADRNYRLGVAELHAAQGIVSVSGVCGSGVLFSYQNNDRGTPDTPTADGVPCIMVPFEIERDGLTIKYVIAGMDKTVPLGETGFAEAKSWLDHLRSTGLIAERKTWVMLNPFGSYVVPASRPTPKAPEPAPKEAAPRLDVNQTAALDAIMRQCAGWGQVDYTTFFKKLNERAAADAEFAKTLRGFLGAIVN